MNKPERNHARLRDVAAEADVSVTTVSNFVNGRYRFMSADTRNRVGVAIAKLNYRPHSAARELRLAEWRSVGLIIVDSSPNYLADGITTHIVSGLSNFLGRHGFSLVVQGLQAGDFSTSPLVSNLKTDALCLMLSGKEEDRKSWIDVLMNLRQPILTFQDHIETVNSDSCTVMQDDEAAGAMLSRHLLERGARDFIHLVPENYHWAGISARLRGATSFQRKHSQSSRSRTVPCDNRSAHAIWAALETDISTNGLPDAVLCNTDEMAISAIKYLTSIGARVPDTVRIAGYNGVGLRDSVTPTLTTVQSRGYDMGAMAGETLISRLRFGKFRTKCLKLPLKLLVGEST
ncbi:MAG: LacI family DNA-binding transcriptional regulator [Rhodospirillaceae bacterium]|nr:LacI family DNA-binding transcriptional regulator [Rhodospirillaceae bacterium]